MRRRFLKVQAGIPIEREDLFAYTNGHFLVDGGRQLNRRYVRFDLDALCNTAATVGESSRVTAVEKMEGGFSKALLIEKSKWNGSDCQDSVPHRWPAFVNNSFYKVLSNKLSSWKLQ